MTRNVSLNQTANFGEIIHLLNMAATQNNPFFVFKSRNKQHIGVIKLRLTKNNWIKDFFKSTNEVIKTLFMFEDVAQSSNEWKCHFIFITVLFTADADHPYRKKASIFFSKFFFPSVVKAFKHWLWSLGWVGKKKNTSPYNFLMCEGTSSSWVCFAQNPNEMTVTKPDQGA